MGLVHEDDQARDVIAALEAAREDLYRWAQLVTALEQLEPQPIPGGVHDAAMGGAKDELRIRCERFIAARKAVLDWRPKQKKRRTKG